MHAVIPLCSIRATGLGLWLALSLPLMLPLSMPAHTAKLNGQALIDALRGGGFNLYFRHAATDWSQQNRVSRRDDWLSCDAIEIRQ